VSIPKQRVGLLRVEMVLVDKTFPMRPEEQGMTRGVAKEPIYLSSERFHVRLLAAGWFSWRSRVGRLGESNVCPSQRHLARTRMNEYAMRINIPPERRRGSGRQQRRLERIGAC